jgi:hypothetical protein
MTPTARTLACLRRNGYAAAAVERWLPGVGRRRDLFGCIDLVAVRQGVPGVLGVQATTTANLSARVRKAQGRAELRTWLAAGNGFECWGWERRNGRWHVRRVEIRAGELAAVPIDLPRPAGSTLLNSGRAGLILRVSVTAAASRAVPPPLATPLLPRPPELLRRKTRTPTPRGTTRRGSREAPRLGEPNTRGRNWTAPSAWAT